MMKENGLIGNSFIRTQYKHILGQVLLAKRDIMYVGTYVSVKEMSFSNSN